MRPEREAHVLLERSLKCLPWQLLLQSIAVPGVVPMLVCVDSDAYSHAVNGQCSEMS
jgi:hypothetical protein